MLSIKIVNGTVIDGSGEKRYVADVGIKGDKIVSIGDLSNMDAEMVIDATNRVVAPGFIDIHTHSDFSILYDASAGSRIYDGVTADVIGNCGIGAAPVSEETKDLLVSYLTTRIAGSVPVDELEINWSSFSDYLEYLESKPKAINVIPLVAQGAIRINEMGFDNAEPTEQQMENMKKAVCEAMDAGACGMSSGLVYLPGSYTSEKELTELCTAIQPYGVKYITHMRNEGNTIYEAVNEALSIARGAGVGLHISHMKLASPKVWGNVKKYFEVIDEAKTSGLDVSFDVYPYICGMGPLTGQVPTWCFENGGVEAMLKHISNPEEAAKIKEEMREGVSRWYSGDCNEAWKHFYVVNVTDDSGKWMEGKSFPELAAIRGKDIPSTILEILIEQKAKVQIRMEAMLQDDMEAIVDNPEAMIGSDSMCMSNDGIMASGMTHPRAYGTHGIILRHFVRERKSLTLESAVRKMTSLPAKVTCLDRRGLLKEGYYADVIVFDPSSVRDNATYENPKQYTSGIDYVIVNGTMALDEGKETKKYTGRVLRRKA